MTVLIMETYCDCLEVKLKFKTYRKTWWRRLLRSIGFDVRINSCGNVYYKVKLLKDGK